jgi:hypothetical protein
LLTLASCAKDKKSIIVPGTRPWEKPRPAAWMINLPGITLNRLFEIGMYIYDKPRTEDK